MDANKLIVLRDLPYEIKKVCALCKHGNFPKNEWGMCEATTYNHKKHSESLRNISIHKFGSCPSFESDIQKVSKLGTFMEFAQFTKEKFELMDPKCDREGCNEIVIENTLGFDCRKHGLVGKKK